MAGAGLPRRAAREDSTEVGAGILSLLIVVGVVAGTVMLFFAWLLEFNFGLRRPAARTDRPRPGEPLKGCAPFELGCGDRAVLLVHGIAGSPAQVRTLGEFLAGEGFKVYAPLLPGHGTHHSDLYYISWQRWYEHVAAEYRRIRGMHKEVFVVGFSLGAALSLRLAAEFPVDRLVVISTPLYWFSEHLPLHLLLRAVRHFAPHSRAFPKRLPETVDGPEYMIYRRVPLDALWALVELSWDVQRRLRDVTAPTLIFHSSRDIAARPRGARQVFRGLGSRWRRLVWLHDTRHGIMHGSAEERQLLRSELSRFLAPADSAPERRPADATLDALS
jgi:carboxylesterase